MRSSRRQRGARRFSPRHHVGPLAVLRLVAGVVAIARLASVRRRPPPVIAADTAIDSAVDRVPRLSVVVPARDEAQRIGPLLDLLIGAPDIAQVIVVDDRSSDSTAEIARAAGATVVSGRELPAGWAGKAWALQQGLAVADGDWVLMLDADTRPDPRLARALVRRAEADRLDLLTVAGRFDCPTAPGRWLHAAMLTSLVYRFGAPGTATRADRLMANGQCMLIARSVAIECGGLEPVAGETVEDIAWARWLAAAGHRVGFLDAADLLEVRMYEDFAETLRGWGRSIALPGVEPRARQLADLAVLIVVQAAPLVRLVVGRGDLLDMVFVAVRLGTLFGTARSYRDRGIAYWSSPTADALAVALVGRGVFVTRQQWRGRQYPIVPPGRNATR